MPTVRPRKVLAVARRDLRQELKGRQGLVLPLVILALLLPASLIPPPASAINRLRTNKTTVSGDVPDAVAALPTTEVVQHHGALVFERTLDPDKLLVHGRLIPRDIRAALDGPTPVVPVKELDSGYLFPGRSLLFALISASTLTGAVSASVGGERSHRTLVVLLAAALSRAEIVVGKWLAWGLLGAISGLMAAGVAIWVGHVDAGSWLIPLPTVPLATVAVGLWLVRRAGDVVAGTTISLRVLPALLAGTAIVAWFLGKDNALFGAIVPLGGALIASGDTWSAQPMAVWLSAGVNLATAVVCVTQTARDLEEIPARAPARRPTALAAVIGALAAFVWWIPLLLPLLWREAGNPTLTAQLPLAAGVLAGSLGLLLFTIVRAGRAPEPRSVLGHPRLGARTALAALLAGAVLVLADPVVGAWSLGATDTLTGFAAERLHNGLRPVLPGLGVGLLALVADELLFRGWLAKAAGPVRAGMVYVAVKAPLDPIGGAFAAIVLGTVGHRFGFVASIGARLVWWLGVPLIGGLML